MSLDELRIDAELARLHLVRVCDDTAQEDAAGAGTAVKRPPRSPPVQLSATATVARRAERGAMSSAARSSSSLAVHHAAGVLAEDPHGLVQPPSASAAGSPLA
jgi:hypothetical protein